MLTRDLVAVANPCCLRISTLLAIPAAY